MIRERGAPPAPALPLAAAPGLPAAQLAEPLLAHFATLAPHWRAPLGAWLASPAMTDLAAFIASRVAAGATVFPSRPLAALAQSAPPDVRAVILGQDPYHGPGQAHGYAFSVPDGVRPPPSLRNILAERARDLGAAPLASGSLLHWSRQGVLLLNTVLTVEQGTPASHAGRGWESFTDAIIDAVARSPVPRVFLLWGAHAQAKRARIEQIGAGLQGALRPLVLTANHPSPLAARRPPQPFIGCGHFSATNRYLQQHGLAPIDW